MEAPRIDRSAADAPRVDWEAFYASYRKPGYVPGFEIQNKLGGGMFGLVFKARKESIGKDYAIKFLKVDDDTVRDAVARELDTVQFFAQIDHPNLVSIEDKGQVDGIPYLVMSYAGDGTLQKRLQQGRLSRDEALRIFVQAARGVQALHDHSLVHFDLKPANIFLKGDVARVGDYGLSKLVSASRNSLSFGRGTPYYMAPEMLQRRGDARSDVYSLGVVLFECLYGEVPFRGDSEWEVLKKHEVAEVPFPAHAAAQDRVVLARCLAKRPEERFQSVAELLHALAAPAALGESLRLPPHAGLRSAPGSGWGGAAAVPAAEPARTAADAWGAPPAAAPVPPPPPPDASRFGVPWQQAPVRRGALGIAVRAVFALFDAVIFVLLLPIRAFGTVFGRSVVWLLRLPFRILGLTAQLIGLLLVAAVLLLAVVTALHLFAP
ncbi:MAG: serine/threonine protein kinase [Planctomycetes bacterium]|nr:serine/threonine protein kinase [Planctomycetota bacterium]